MFRILSTLARKNREDADGYLRDMSRSSRAADYNKVMKQREQELHQLRRRFGFYL